mgnify:CR=1 FL=1
MKPHLETGRHTPGPWKVVPRLSGSENHRGYQIVAKPKAWTIAEAIPVDHDGIEGGANARLIAAAPELLQALQNLVSDIDDGTVYGQRLAQAHAAIAKATGAA